jgi:hypothetical protein
MVVAFPPTVDDTGPIRHGRIGDEKRHGKELGGQDDSPSITRPAYEDLAAKAGKGTASGGEEVIPDERDEGTR